MAAAAPELLSRHRCFGGWQHYYRHWSTSIAAEMRFALYLPPAAADGPVPWLVWLSGLTCNEETFAIKAGAQRVAAELGLGLLAPDTSPRVRLPGDDESWDFGLGAGFYVDATEAPWSAHYRMYRYVADELPVFARAHFPLDPARLGLFGHSMGGHGALTIGLRNPDRFRTLSAFAPIAAPMQCPWGQKALPGYLGPDPEAWRQYDATAIMAGLGPVAGRPPLLIDQGLEDPFLDSQLRPGLFESACNAQGYPLTLRRHAGYDHGYFFIASFIEDHLRHHAAGLAASG